MFLVGERSLIEPKEGAMNKGRLKKTKRREAVLRSLGFVFLPGGRVKVGTENPVSCRLEGFRRNETPERIFTVKPFWIAACCTTNQDFEKFNPHHKRPPTSPGDKHPVTDITYLEAISYAQWLSEEYRMNFTLPDELQWTFAAGQFGWNFSYREEKISDKNMANVFDPKGYRALEVDDDRFGVNFFGLYHMSGNVREITRGWHYARGHLGSRTDGAYYIAKGGDFGHCPLAAAIPTRFIVDVAERSTRTGFRLIHPDA